VINATTFDKTIIQDERKTMDGCSLLARSLLLAVILSTSASAQPPGVRWRPEIEAAKAEARQTGRLVLVHFSTPTCAPCRRLEHAVFNQPTVGIAIESQFVPVKLNANDHPTVAKTYGVTAVPTDVIITPDGQPVGKLVSPPTPTAYISEVTQIANRSKTPSSRAFAAGTNNAPAQPPMNAAYAHLPVEQLQPQPSTPEPQPQTYTTPIATGAGLTTTSRPQPMAGNQGRITNLHVQPDAAPVAPRATTLTQPTAGMAATSPRIPPAAGQPAVPHRPLRPAINKISQQTVANQSPPLVGSRYASAEDPTPGNVAATPWPKVPQGNPPLAFDGYCPVSMKGYWKWVPGNVKWGAIHRGRTYLFVGEAEQQQFLANPDKFSPVLSGADAVIAVDQRQRIEGRREHGLEYNGQFYLFSTEASLQQFSSNPERYAEGVRQAVGTTPEKTVR
jgi:protein disulfide-isomerase